MPESSQNSCYKYIDIVYLNFDRGYPASKYSKHAKLECSYTSWKPTPVFLVAPSEKYKCEEEEKVNSFCNKKNSLREKPQKVNRFR